MKVLFKQQVYVFQNCNGLSFKIGVKMFGFEFGIKNDGQFGDQVDIIDLGVVNGIVVYLVGQYGGQ